ncbi:hypothetical protein HDA32_001467 [Spinactinospora alkalitolerans]|uniref:PIN domain-containing protein n=1 Tax=Spinactinospora alkalitolerans TaxID=687207 RepID=A0A852TST4_9ACTN|nr:PIN domain-containing protein [Spinactinospora alkalitolerans]NYE46347.1 hypothetical protein [Spinactinospora alkalitolerans]
MIQVVGRRPVLYDAGALLAAERGDPEMLSLHRGFCMELMPRIIPASVLTQVWRDGACQARLARFLKSCKIHATPEDTAREAGLLLGRSGTKDVVDATVVATARSLGATMIVTSDEGDIKRLWEVADSRVHVTIRHV